MRNHLLILLSILIFTNCNWVKENIWGSAKSKLDKTIVEKSKDNLFDFSYGNYHSEEGIDITSSEISFEIDGLSETKGRFKSFDINLERSSEDENLSLYVTIDPNSIYTDNEMRDEHLLNEEFFNAKNFPLISFESNNIIKTDSCYLAHGKLSLLGNDNALTLPFNYLGSTENPDGKNIYIFEGEINFDRTDFGMAEAESVGNLVKLNYYTELSKK